MSPTVSAVLGAAVAVLLAFGVTQVKPPAAWLPRPPLGGASPSFERYVERPGMDQPPSLGWPDCALGAPTEQPSTLGMSPRELFREYKTLCLETYPETSELCLVRKQELAHQVCAVLLQHEKAPEACDVRRDWFPSELSACISGFHADWTPPAPETRAERFFPQHSPPGWVGPVPLKDVLKALAPKPGRTLVVSPRNSVEATMVACQWDSKDVRPRLAHVWYRELKTGKGVPWCQGKVDEVGCPYFAPPTPPLGPDEAADYAFRVSTDGGWVQVAVPSAPLWEQDVWLLSYACRHRNLAAIVKAVPAAGGEVLIFEDKGARWEKAWDAPGWIE
jgi:hypothetical protein